MARWIRSWLTAIVFACVSTQAGAQAVLVADAGDAPKLGVSRALGAVIWNHAGESPRQADPAPAVFVRLLRDAGYDVFRLERPPEGDTINVSTRALIRAARDLRAEGYARIVLAGQSAGAWIALAGVAAVPDLAEAVIATAPAAYGKVSDDPRRAARNRDELLQLVERVQSARVMMFLFDGDEFDPGGRGHAVADALRARRVPHLVVDRPQGWRGHGVGLTRAFARRFGACIVAFVTLPSTDDLACDRLPAASVPFEFVNVPERMPRPANDNNPLSHFVGAWRGSLDNGDDVMLVVEGGPSDRVRALFARGRSRNAAGDKPFAQRQHGRFDAEGRILVFDEPDRLRITAVLAGEDRLRVSVVNADGRRQFTGELAPVDAGGRPGRTARLSP